MTKFLDSIFIPMTIPLAAVIIAWGPGKQKLRLTQELYHRIMATSERNEMRQDWTEGEAGIVMLPEL